MNDKMVVALMKSLFVYEVCYSVSQRMLYREKSSQTFKDTLIIITPSHFFSNEINIKINYLKTKHNVNNQNIDSQFNLT